MAKDFVTVTEEEKKEMEKWMQQNYSLPKATPVDIWLFILYKIHLLEEKINRIEQQTKTHWIK
jgi:formiminotetrahydrofolate cyclodeaminase